MKKLEKKLKDLTKKGFQPGEIVEVVDSVYTLGSPYPQGLICRWWAENSKGKRILIEEKILKCH